jgi:hypothetical protein
MPFSTVSVIRCFFILYSTTRVGISHLLPSVCYILYYMINAQPFLQPQFVRHGEHTICSIVHSMLDVQLFFRPQCVLHTEHIYHTHIVSMATYVCHSVRERPSSPALSSGLIWITFGTVELIILLQLISSSYLHFRLRYGCHQQKNTVSPSLLHR